MDGPVLESNTYPNWFFKMADSEARCLFIHPSHLGGLHRETESKMDGAPFSLLQSLTYVWKMKGTKLLFLLGVTLASLCTLALVALVRA